METLYASRTAATAKRQSEVEAQLLYGLLSSRCNATDAACGCPQSEDPRA